MKFVLIAILVLTSSCKNQKSLMVADENQDNQLTLLVQDGYFFTDSMETSVIRDEKTLRSFFSQVNKTRKPGLPVPNVNFEEEIALVVCMGAQREMGVPYLELLQNENKEVLIGIKMEAESKKQSPITSYPFCVYKMPIPRSEIIFRQL